MFSKHLREVWRTFLGLYKRLMNRHHGGCNWQCVSWLLFETPLAQCSDCKVDETREAGMSNMRAFPAVVFGERQWGALCGSFKPLLLHAKTRSAPVSTGTNSKREV